MQALALRIQHPDHHGRLFRHQPEALLGILQVPQRVGSHLFGLGPFEAEAELARDGDSQRLGGV